MKLTAHLELVPRLRMSETQLTLNVPYGCARRQPYFYVDNTGSKHQNCSTSTCLLSMVGDGHNTHIAIHLYCQSKNVIYCQGRIITPWNNTVTQLVKAFPIMY